MITQGKQDHSKAEIRKERRRHLRRIFHCRVEVMSTSTKEHVKCASCDLAEGGIRVITTMELKDPEYLIIVGNKKIRAKLIYEEKRQSSMLNQTAFYHGLAFEKPIDQEAKNYLIALAEKNGF